MGKRFSNPSLIAHYRSKTHNITRNPFTNMTRKDNSNG